MSWIYLVKLCCFLHSAMTLLSEIRVICTSPSAWPWRSLCQYLSIMKSLLYDGQKHQEHSAFQTGALNGLSPHLSSSASSIKNLELLKLWKSTRGKKQETGNGINYHPVLSGSTHWACCYPWSSVGRNSGTPEEGQLGVDGRGDSPLESLSHFLFWLVWYFVR